MAIKPEHIDAIRHSLAHLLAAAVLKRFPKAKLGIGPTIENGFYYDFEFTKPLAESDLPKIEKKMRELMKSWDTFEKHELSAADAKNEYPNNPFKAELIDEFSTEGQSLTLYTSGAFTDLCRGGHADGLANIDPECFTLDGEGPIRCEPCREEDAADAYRYNEADAAADEEWLEGKTK